MIWWLGLVSAALIKSIIHFSYPAIIYLEQDYFNQQSVFLCGHCCVFQIELQKKGLEEEQKDEI